MSNKDANRTLAVIVGIAALAGPRRTRPLSGFLYGLFLSRAHGATVGRLTEQLHGLFAQKTSALDRIDKLDRRAAEHDDDVTVLIRARDRMTDRLEAIERSLVDLEDYIVSDEQALVGQARGRISRRQQSRRPRSGGVGSLPPQDARPLP